MFRSQINPPRPFQRFSASDLATASLTPFLATFRKKSQLIQYPAALSRVVATLTRHLHHNPFVCHSYKKHPGGGYTLAPAISFRNLTTRHSPLATKSFIIRTSAKPARNPFGIRTSKTQNLKLFRMNTSEKTPRGEGSSRRCGGTDFSLCPPNLTLVSEFNGMEHQSAASKQLNRLPAAVVGSGGDSHTAEFVGVIFAVEDVPLLAVFEDFFFLRGDFFRTSRSAFSSSWSVAVMNCTT